MSQPVQPTSVEAWLIEALAPRPLVWVTTLSGAGEVNLAPFSALTIVCNSPPTLLLAIERVKDGRMKRTAQNIIDEQDFVVNSPSREQLERLMGSADPTVPPERRAEAAAIRLTRSARVKSPLILGCNSALECRMGRHECVGDFPCSDVFWAEVVKVHLHPTGQSSSPRPFLGALGYQWFVSEQGTHFVEQPYL